MKKILLLITLFAISSSMAQGYQYLGTFNADGTPDYLEEVGDIVTSTFMDTINNALPESYPVPDYNPQYLSSGFDTDIFLEEAADVWVTFVTEGAGYKNVLGFYTYDYNAISPKKPQAEDITIIFPNVSASGSGGGLIPGDKVHIGTFPPGTGIGWVLLANGYQNNQVTSGNWQLFSNESYNPENDTALRQHNVLLNDPAHERIILGFEDIRRDYASCDQDFNDAIFYITANPYQAIKTTNLSDPDPGASRTSSGNDGGLESNGNLAGLIARRNLKRLKENNKMSKRRMQPSFFNKKSSFSGTLDAFLPTTGKYGSEVPQYATPTDLLGITNATQVVAVDYYDREQRVSAVLATATKGSVYDHAKAICDRLNSSSLEDVRTVTVRGHQLLSSKIKRSNGDIEYTVSFSIKLGEKSNELFSFWNIDRYPSGDYNNFQIWGGSYSQVFHIANHIIDTFKTSKKLNSKKPDNVVPPLFVKSGYYNNGQIFLKVINKSGSHSMIFRGNLKETEVAGTTAYQETLALTGDLEQTIAIRTGSIFDIGFSISPDQNTQIDALYLADGPWGLDYLQDKVAVNNFKIENIMTATAGDAYAVERNPSLQGSIKETLNLFRHLRAGDQVVPVKDYEQISFRVQNSLPVEVILITDEEIDWEDRWKYTIPPHSTMSPIAITFTDFTNSKGQQPKIEKLRSVVFSISGDYLNFKPFKMGIMDLKFKQNTLAVTSFAAAKKTTLINYPNPFKGVTTINLVNPSTEVTIRVIDMLGRTVDVQKLAAREGLQVQYRSPQLKSGVYKYVITDTTLQTFQGSFLIR